MEDNQQPKLKERLKDPYRLIIMNDETFEEVGSYKLTILNVYIILSALVVLVSIIILLLLTLTPLKTYIPGYGDASKATEIIRLNKALDEMEKEITARETYLQNLRTVLVGDVQPAEPIEIELQQLPDSAHQVERIAEDEQLRREIAMDQKIYNQSPESGLEQQKLKNMFFITPAEGIIGHGFEMSEDHIGVDIIAPKNTPIKATLDGYVFMADWTRETGHTIGIQHANGLLSFYKHNSSLLKSTGDRVKSGEAVAIVGNTGKLTDGPHLHFELWQNGTPLDPTKYINFE